MPVGVSSMPLRISDMTFQAPWFSIYHDFAQLVDITEYIVRPLVLPTGGRCHYIADIGYIEAAIVPYEYFQDAPSCGKVALHRHSRARRHALSWTSRSAQRYRYGQGRWISGFNGLARGFTKNIRREVKMKSCLFLISQDLVPSVSTLRRLGSFIYHLLSL